MSLSPSTMPWNLPVQLLAGMLIIPSLIGLTVGLPPGDLSSSRTWDFNEPCSEALQESGTQDFIPLDSISQSDRKIDENDIEGRKLKQLNRMVTMPMHADSESKGNANNRDGPSMLKTRLQRSLLRWGMSWEFRDIVASLNYKKAGSTSEEKSKLLQDILNSVKTLAQQKLIERFMPKPRFDSTIIDGIDKDTSGLVFDKLKEAIIKDLEVLLENGKQAIYYEPVIFLVARYLATHRLVPFELLGELMNKPSTVEIAVKVLQGLPSEIKDADSKYLSALMTLINNAQELWKLLSQKNLEKLQTEVKKLSLWSLIEQTGLSPYWDQSFQVNRKFLERKTRSTSTRVRPYRPYRI